MADGKVYDAVIVGIDPTGDVGLVKLFGRDDFPYAELGDSDRLRAGDWVFAMGNPFLLATDLQPTVTYGIVSGVHRYQFPAGTLLEYADCIQTDASINPGNSGGPLFDAEGRLVGINGRGSFEKRGRVNVGVGYAISINQIKNFLGSASQRPDRRSRHARRPRRRRRRRPRRRDRHPRKFRRLPPRAPLRRRDRQFRRPADLYAQRIQERAGNLSQGLARAAELSPRRQALRRPGPADGRTQPGGIAGDGGRPPARARRCPCPNPRTSRKPGPREGERPKERPKRLPIPGLPGNRPPAHAEAPVPEIVRKHFEEKRGFANYYFNKLNQERVWKAWNARANLAGTAGDWTLSGPLEQRRGVPLPIDRRTARR